MLMILNSLAVNDEAIQSRAFAKCASELARLAHCRREKKPAPNFRMTGLVPLLELPLIRA